MKPISTETRQSIISLLLAGDSCREVARKVGVGKTTVERVRLQVDPDKENIKIGCPSKLSDRDRRRLVHEIESGKVDNAIQATQLINSVHSTPISAQTVRNALKKEDMRAVVKTKRPLLKAAHRKARLAFAHKYKNWTIDDWKMVLWSDETKINKIGSDGRVYVWKKRGEPLSDRTTTTTVKHGGGNIMVWGCMGWEGVGVLSEVEGIMDKHQYVDILSQGVPESRQKLGLSGEDFYFQQDNDPKHTSKHASKLV